jgi:hypothetical protein
MGTTSRTSAVPGVLQDPVSNRGVAFSQAERDRLGLTGRLPSAVLTLDQQALRACGTGSPGRWARARWTCPSASRRCGPRSSGAQAC